MLSRSIKLLLIALLVFMVAIDVGSAKDIVPNLNYSEESKLLPYPWSPVDWGRATNSQNLVPDPSFEDGSLWGLYNGAGLVTGFAHNGSKCAYINSTGYTTKYGTILSPYINVTPNTVYEVEAWIYSYSDGWTRYLRVDWYNATQTYIGHSDVIYFINKYRHWFKVYLLAKSPPDAYYARIRVTQNNAIGNDSIVYVDDVSMRVFTAFVLKEGSYYEPLALDVNELPKQVTLHIMVWINQSIVGTNITNFTVKLNGKNLNVLSYSYNSTTGYWDVVVEFPRLKVGIYNLTVEADHLDTGYHFYTKGRVWVYDPNELNDLLILHTSDVHVYTPATERETDGNNTNYVNAMYYAELAKEFGVDLVIDTGDWGDTYTMRPAINFADYLAKYGIPVFFVAGNHEGHPKFTVNMTQSQYWEITRQIGNPDRYYSLDLGKYYLIALWTDELNTGGSGYAQISNEQLQWFLNELNKAKALGKKIIVALHTEIYDPNVGLSTEWVNTTQQQIIYDAIMNNPNVVLVLQGHNHNIQPAVEKVGHVYWVMTLGYGHLTDDGQPDNCGVTIIRLNDSGVFVRYIPVFKYTRMVGVKNLFENRTFMLEESSDKIVVGTEMYNFSELPVQTNNNTLCVGATLCYHPNAKNVLLLRNIKVGINEYEKVPAYVSSNSDVNVTVNEYTPSKISFTANAPKGSTVTFTFTNLEPGSRYQLYVDGSPYMGFDVGRDGTITFKWSRWSNHNFELVRLKTPTIKEKPSEGIPIIPIQPTTETGIDWGLIATILSITTIIAILILSIRR